MPPRFQNDHRVSVRRAARKRRHRPIPMSSGLVHDTINVLLQQVAVLRQRIGGCSDPTQVIVAAAVTLLDREARIVIILSFRACPGERYIGSRHRDERVRLALSLASESPATVGAER